MDDPTDKIDIDVSDIVLLTTFTNGNKQIRVIYHHNTIVWDFEKPPYEQHTVKIENVLSIKHTHLKSSHPSQTPQSDPHSFVIYYAIREEGSKWKCKSLTLKHSDPFQVASWVKTLQKQLQCLTHRPKRLLIFVNPFGGKRNSMQIYTKYGKPLFDIADIDVTVNVSQRKDQIRDYIINHNLDMFDSVAVVGGDGTVSELFNGLVLRECKTRGVDADDIESILPRPRIPIGIIPGGSTDALAYCLHGTTDPTTAVLHIIFGDSLGLDLVSVYDQNNLLQLYATVLSYGYLGDVAYNSDRHRWMGPRRYIYSGFKKILTNRGYKGEIAILSDQNAITQEKCYENCESCITTPDNNLTPAQWQTVKGKFFMVSGANISCACSHSPNGIAPFGHLGDGNIHLIIVKHTSIINNLRLLLRLSSKNQTVDDLPFVETLCVKEFCFRAVDATSRWNCDGEIQHISDIRTRVNRQLLTIFSRGKPRIPESETGCCGI